MKIIKLITLIISISLFGCRNDKEESIVHYYKAINDGKIVSYQKIDYSYASDSIKESITIFNLKGDIIQKQSNNFIKSENGLDIIINGNKRQYLRSKKKDDCVYYKGSMGYHIRNCFIERTSYRDNKDAIKFSYSEEVTDGLNMTIYLDNNYSLIDKKEIIGSGAYEELIRIDKSSIPQEISK